MVRRQCDYHHLPVCSSPVDLSTVDMKTKETEEHTTQVVHTLVKIFKDQQAALDDVSSDVRTNARAVACGTVTMSNDSPQPVCDDSDDIAESDGIVSEVTTSDQSSGVNVDVVTSDREDLCVTSQRDALCDCRSVTAVSGHSNPAYDPSDGQVCQDPDSREVYTVSVQIEHRAADSAVSYLGIGPGHQYWVLFR